MRANYLLLNTLYVQTQGAFLRLEGETLRVEHEGKLLLQVPLHHLGAIVLFGNVPITPQLLAKCADSGKQIVWLSSSGRFRGRLEGPLSGNVLLRRAQHQALNNSEMTAALARAFVYGKLRNAKAVLHRAVREYRETTALREALRRHEEALRELPSVTALEEIRGLEGAAAAEYYKAFGDMILVPGFTFGGRFRRPPRDKVNAVLSLISTLLVMEAGAALESVGLDPQVGYLHSLRPGKPALALDLVEEFRPWWGDRLALALINRRQVVPEHFVERPGGAVMLTDEGRRVVITAFQKRKQEEVRHPLAQGPVPLALLPHLQARILARHLRGDLPAYSPFIVR